MAGAAQAANAPLIDPPLLGEMRRRHGPFAMRGWAVEGQFLILAGFVAGAAIAVTTRLGRLAGGDGLESALRTGSSRRASGTAVPGAVPTTGLSRCTEGKLVSRLPPIGGSIPHKPDAQAKADARPSLARQACEPC